MRVKSRAMAIAGISAVALLATACGGDSGSSSDSAGKTGGEIIARGCQPQNPLIGGNTGESCGHDIVELFTSTLYRYDAETGKPVKDLAESFEADEANQNFTVKIKPGVKFQDGTPVTAKSFVDAWNYTAYGPNAQYLSYFMEPIEGFKDVQGEKPKEKEMSGLKVVDDTTFTIKTAEPTSNLEIRLGYTAFAPQPEAFFKDPEAFAKKPIGAGPYKVEDYQEGKQAVLTKYNDYGGQAAAGNVDKITFRFYQDQDAAYADLQGGNIDVIDQVPASAMIDKKFESDLPDRWAQEPYPAIQTITFAPEKTSPEYKDPKIRQAISMAIDRQKIVDDHFDGARELATSWGAPGIEGFNEGTCGKYCEYNAAEAKKLLDEAGGFKGKMTIGYNADGDHKAWVTATCDSIRTALGVDCTATPVTDFATFRKNIGEQKQKGMFRSGWIADYPHIENFLTPLYSTGGSSNDGKYSNPDFDKALTDAAKLTGEESLAKYKEAEEMLAKDMPSIPLWYYTATVGWSEKVANAKISVASGRVDLLSISVK